MSRPDSKSRHSKYPELEQARSVRAATLDLLDHLSQEQVDFAPSEGAWSLGEIADHLLKTAGAYRVHFEELLARKKAGKTPFVYRGIANFVPVPKPLRLLLPVFEIPFALPNSLFPGAARRSFMTGRTIPLKAPPSFEPEVGRPVEELRADLREWLEELDRLQGEDVNLEKLYFYNPVIGLVTLPKAIDFLSGHEERHQKQMGEILGRDDFPDA